MSYFKRFLAKFFDYSLLYSLLYLIGTELDIIRTHILIIALALIVPFLWVFFETLFLKFFGTTPGKALLGIRLKEKLTLKKAFTRSLRTWAQVMGCGIPPFNLACPLVALYQAKRRELPSDLTCKKGGFARVAICILLIGAFSSSSIIWDHLHPKSTATLSITEEGYKDWSALQGDLFTAYYPAKPESTDSTLVLPEDYDNLPLTEHKVTHNDIEYSIAYTTMPRAWLKYSNSMILKYSVKYMANEMEDTTIVTRGYSEHGPHKAVDYVLNSKGKTIAGRMLLIKDRMYKVEVISEPSAEVATQVDLFRGAFIPS